MSYHGQERRSTALSEEQIDAIAERAAAKALSKVYAQVGEGMLKKLAWVLGAAVVALLLWMGGKGITLK